MQSSPSTLPLSKRIKGGISLDTVPVSCRHSAQYRSFAGSFIWIPPAFTLLFSTLSLVIVSL